MLTTEQSSKNNYIAYMRALELKLSTICILTIVLTESVEDSCNTCTTCMFHESYEKVQTTETRRGWASRIWQPLPFATCKQTPRHDVPYRLSRIVPFGTQAMVRRQACATVHIQIKRLQSSSTVSSSRNI